jgi:CRP/FNR family transcriptional regulator, cyclic AMP receptor protein
MRTLDLFKNREGEAIEAGGVLFAEGDQADDMFVVKSGEIDVVVAGNVVQTIGPGEILGEMALVDDGPRSATAVARTDAEVVRVDRRRFEFMVQQTPGFATTVLAIVAERLRAANARADRRPAADPPVAGSASV